MNRISAVFLDVDDTLIDYRSASQAAFHAALGPDADYDALMNQPHYDRYLAGELGFDEMRVLRMADYLRSIGRDADAERAADFEQRRFEGLVPLCTLFADAAPLLAALRERGLEIGLITNNEPIHQWAKLRAVGLDRLVDAVAVSGALGWPKPDPRIFDFACEQLSVEPGQALHVGDNLVADAIGARDAGLSAAWLDRFGSRRDTDVPDGISVIGTLHEILVLLG